MGQELRNRLKDRLFPIFQNVQRSDNTPERKAELMAEAAADVIVSQLKVSIPVGTVIIAATGGVPNPVPIECTVESR